MTIQWPEGRDGGIQILGRGRDAWTDAAGAPPEVLAEQTLDVRLDPQRTIVELEAVPHQPALDTLLGQHAILGLRSRVAEALGTDADDGALLYQLADDLAGSTVITSWIWTRWPETREIQLEQSLERRQRMVGVCAGYAVGASSFDPRREEPAAVIVPIQHPDDPLGWHALPPAGTHEMRRARRIDLWDEAGELHVDAFFQDSATVPGGQREAVHEYALKARIDLASRSLSAVEADPRVLPFVECPGVAASAQRLAGTPLARLRQRVLMQLRSAAGCTHLNDMLRALAPVAALAERVAERL